MGNDGSGSEGVQCITDLTTCCRGANGQHRGDWYFPNGTRLHFFMVLSLRVVVLRELINVRRRNNANSPTGIYHCDVPTLTVHDNYISVRDTVYVGLYTGSGGMLLM